MWLSRPRSSVVLPAVVAAALLSALPLVSAVPYARDDLHDAGYGYLVPRQCNGGYCGTANDLCCGVDQACTTIDASPTCIERTGNELKARDVYTTTWTETKTYTRTVSSQEQVATTAIVYEKCVPPDGSGQIACGNVCCGTWQYCAYEGQCLDSASAAAGGAITSAGGAITGAITTTISGVRTTMYSAPYKVTSGASITSTTTATSNGTAIAATGGGGGLSGGAIAGIVIGVIAGVILLLLLCFCCLVRGAWGAVSGIFGRKRKSEREKIVVEEERYVRHNVGAAAAVHSHGSRSRHDSWYGEGRPSAGAARKKEGGKGLLGMAAGLGTLALLLGLKRDERAKPAKSHRTRSSTYSSSYYTDSYTGSSPSSASSDRRTRQSRGSRGTRTTRHTRTSRRSSRR